MAHPSPAAVACVGGGNIWSLVLLGAEVQRLLLCLNINSEHDPDGKGKMGTPTHFVAILAALEAALLSGN